MSSSHWPRALERIAWPIAFVVALPTAMVAARILRPEGAAEVAAGTRHVAIENARKVTTARGPAGGGGGGGGSISSYLFDAALFGAVFVMLDEYAGLDILYRALGADILPKTRLQRMLRGHRAMLREARASGSPSRLREAFFRTKRERFGLAGVKFQEEPMKAPWDMGRQPGGEQLLDPQDVRVFFILSKGSSSVVGKIYIAFNVDPSEPGVGDRVERTTKWILTRQVESRLARGELEMPCRLQRAYRDRAEGEHLVQWGRNEDGSHTLADAWDCRRTVFVDGDEVRSEM